MERGSYGYCIWTDRFFYFFFGFIAVHSLVTQAAWSTNLSSCSHFGHLLPRGASTGWLDARDTQWNLARTSALLESGTREGEAAHDHFRDSGCWKQGSFRMVGPQEPPLTWLELIRLRLGSEQKSAGIKNGFRTWIRARLGSAFVRTLSSGFLLC